MTDTSGGEPVEGDRQDTTGEDTEKQAGGESLPLRVQVSYTLGQLGWAILINLVGFWLVFLYSGEFDPEKSIALIAGLGLSVIVGGGRLFDAVTDPLIAKFSDEASFEWGRRLPFMAGGALPAGVFCVLLFAPPDGSATALNILWLAGMSICFYLFLTLYGTPYFALLPELSRGTGDRVNLATGIAVGWALGLAIAAQASGLWNGLAAATDLSRLAAIRTSVAILAGIAVLCMYAPVVLINERKYADSTPSSRSLRKTLRAFAGNRDFISYIVADFSYFAGLTLIITALPFYTSVLLYPDQQEFAENLVGILTISVILTWFLFYPLVNVLAKRLGKKRLIRLAFLSLGAVFCLITVLGLVPLPKIVQAFGVSVLSAIPMAFLAVLPNAVLGDIAKLDANETGDPQEGLFFAGRTFVQKLGQSVGLFVFPALMVLGNDPGDALGIRLSGVVGATLCFAAFVAFRYYRESMITERLASYETGTQAD